MVVTNDTTLAEVDEAIGNLLADARKADASGNDLRWAALHRQIDELCEDRDVLVMLTPANG